MSAGTLTVYDSFSAALESLREAMPDHFAFEIDQAFFSNLGMAEAIRKQGMMRSFVHEVGRMGYSVHIAQTRDFRYLYDLRRVSPVEPTPATAKPIEEGAIDV